MNETRLAARALVIQPDGTGEVREVATDLVGLQAVVGGYLQAVTFPDFHLYCDEEGKFNGREPNPTATAFARSLGWQPLAGDRLVGTVLFLGGSGGSEDDLPHSVIEAWQGFSGGEYTEVAEVSIKVALDEGIDPGHPAVAAAVINRAREIRESGGKMPTTLDLRGFHFGHGMTTLVTTLPKCDIHGANGDTVEAMYDAKTRQGPWANMCGECFARMGIKLGTGYGQRLIQRTEENTDV